VLRHRILGFPLPEQTLHVLGLALASSLAVLLLNLALGADAPNGIFLLSPLLTALAWAPTNWILYSTAVRRRRREMAS
jgi:cell shape-determining protein MreD